MATPRKPRLTAPAPPNPALAAEPPVPVPAVPPPFEPAPVVLPPLDIPAFLMKNLEALGFTGVTISSETAPDDQMTLRVAGKNFLGATITCSPIFAPEALPVVVMQTLKAMVNAVGWADPHTDIPVVTE